MKLSAERMKKEGRQAALNQGLPVVCLKTQTMVWVPNYSWYKLWFGMVSDLSQLVFYLYSVSVRLRAFCWAEKTVLREVPLSFLTIVHIFVCVSGMWTGRLNSVIPTPSSAWKGLNRDKLIVIMRDLWSPEISPPPLPPYKHPHEVWMSQKKRIKSRHTDWSCY